MIIEHMGHHPYIDASTYVAPNATICGDVKIGKNSRIMFGAQIIAENSAIHIGDNCIVLENAVIRGTAQLPVNIGDNCLIGPHAHITGCRIEDNVFLATGSSVFHGAVVRTGAEVRINGVVHLKTVLPENQVLPIGCIAVGDPMQVFSPGQHEEIWEVQKTLNFPRLVYGIADRTDLCGMNKKLCQVMSDRLSAHFSDRVVSTDIYTDDD